MNNAERKIQQVKEMTRFCTPEGIASALKMPLETVMAILAGNYVEIEPTSEGQGQPIVMVKATTQVHRQKVIGMVRAKGGVGTSTLGIHLAFEFCETLKTLYMDYNPNGGDIKRYVNEDYYDIGRSLALLTFRIADNLQVFFPPRQERHNPTAIYQSFQQAKQDFDVVLVDIPNQGLEFTKEITHNCNVLLVIIDSTLQEAEKLLSWDPMASVPYKYLVVNNGQNLKPDEKSFNSIGQHLGVKDGVYLPYEPELPYAFYNADIVSRKSPYQESIRNLAERIYPGILKNEEKTEGLFGKISKLIGRN